MMHFCLPWVENKTGTEVCFIDDIMTTLKCINSKTRKGLIISILKGTNKKSVQRMS